MRIPKSPKLRNPKKSEIWNDTLKIWNYEIPNLKYKNHCFWQKKYPLLWNLIVYQKVKVWDLFQEWAIRKSWHCQNWLDPPPPSTSPPPNFKTKVQKIWLKRPTLVFLQWDFGYISWFLLKNAVFCRKCELLKFFKYSTLSRVVPCERACSKLS